MKVELKNVWIIGNAKRFIGDVVEVSEREAEHLLSNGFAVAVEAAETVTEGVEEGAEAVETEAEKVEATLEREEGQAPDRAIKEGDAADRKEDGKSSKGRGGRKSRS